jgi:uncharacterized protein
MIESRNKPESGEVEQRSAPDATLTIEDGRLRGLIPYGVESRDLGGWSEVIEPGALDGADMSDLVATLNHAGVPLGRFDSTLTVESRDDGLAWSVELGDGPTASDVRAAVERGDLNQSSWRMVVGKDRWTGTTRHVTEIRSLRDVAVVTTGAYPAEATRVEIRERPERPASFPTNPKEEHMPHRNRGGGLAVESRNEAGGADIESRIIDAMAAVPSGESRDLTHATAEPVEPPELSQFVWDNLRDHTVLLQAGVPVLATNRRKVVFPTITGDIDVDFYGELEDIDPDDPTLDELEIEPKAVKGLVRGSSEAFEDASPDLLNLVQTNLSQSMGLKLDYEGINGGSTKGFPGLLKISGTQSLDLAEKAFASYDPIIAAVGLLAEAGVAGPYATICHPRVATAIDRLKEFGASETNVPLGRPDGLPPFFTSKGLPIKAGSGEKPPTTSVIVFAPKSFAMVRRLETRIEVDRSQEFTKDAVFVRGKVRAALGTAYPQAAVLIKNVKSVPITL